jgi:hypothetical protein
MVLGFTMYAGDNDDFLPRSNRHPWGFGPWYFRMQDGIENFDNRQVAIDYGFILSTGHPVIDAPPITDPPNTKVSYTAGPWHYLPGYLSPSQAATTAVAAGPVKLNAGSSTAQMMQDMMIWALVHLPPWRYQGIQLRHIGDRHEEGGPTNPSHVFYGANTDNPLDLLGAYCGWYDGSVRLRMTEKFQWALWNTTGGGLYFAHAQGMGD